MSQQGANANNDGCLVTLLQLLGLLVALFLVRIFAWTVILSIPGIVGAFVALKATGQEGRAVFVLGYIACFLGINPCLEVGAVLMGSLVCLYLQRSYQSKVDSPHAVGQVISIGINSGKTPEVEGPIRINIERVVVAVFKGLKETAYCFAIGLFLVVIVNAIVGRLNPQTVDLHRAETAVLDAQVALATITNRGFLLCALVVAVIASCIRPSSKPVSAVTNSVRWVKRVALPITVLCTFALYVSVSQNDYQKIWALVHRQKMIKSLKDIELYRKATIAAVRAADRISQMSSQQQAEFTQQYQSIHGMHDPASEASAFGAAIGAAASDLNPGSDAEERTAVTTSYAVSVRGMQAWLQTPDNSKEPTKSELKSGTDESERAKATYQQSKEALIEVIKSYTKIPATDPYLKPFVDSLIGSIVKTTMGKVIPESIPDLASARQWWLKLKSTHPQNADQNWSWTEHAVGHEEDQKQTTTIEALVADQTATASAEFDRRNYMTEGSAEDFFRSPITSPWVTDVSGGGSDSGIEDGTEPGGEREHPVEVP